MLGKILARVRPTAFGEGGSRPDVSTATVFGWYARKGLGPALRGVLWLPRFGKAELPVFVGSRVSISYARRVRIGRSSSIGSGSRILAFSRSGISIGTRVTIREGAWIQCSSSPWNPGEGLIIGDDTYIGPGSILGVGGLVTIGARCQIGSSFTVVAENHAISDSGTSSTEVVRSGITVGDGCWIGHRVTILDGVELGENCVVGAGAVVTKSFPAGSKIAGVPARAI